MRFVLEQLSKGENNISSEIKKALSILKLTQCINRSDTLNKSYEEVKKDYSNWKLISERVREILSK